MSNKKTKTKTEIIKLLKQHDKDLKEKFKVKEIGLFGSYIRGEQNKQSDIDLIVEFDLKAFGDNFEGLYDTFIALSSYLEKLFGRKVDILTPTSINTIRIKEVAKNIKRSVVYV